MTAITFGIFLVLFLGVGALAARQAEMTDDDYLLGNRSFNSFFVGLSAGATGNSGFIMVGMVGMAYTTGISALLLPLSVLIGEWIFWTYIAERVNRFSVESNAVTIPEMLGTVCSKNQEKQLITSVVALVTIVLVGAYAVAQFAASGKALGVFFNISEESGAILATAAILSYCVFGGLRASIWTDVVQACIVVLVSFGMLGLAYSASNGFAHVLNQLYIIDPSLSSIWGGKSVSMTIAFILGFVVLGVGFGMSQPPVLVRILAGRSPKAVREAKWIYLGYVYSTWIAMTLFGVFMRILLPDLSDPEQALPLFASAQLHSIFLGIVLAGIFSVIASTADSQILACSSALARDVSPTMNRVLGKVLGTYYQQVSTLVFGIAALVVTLNFSSSVFWLVLFAVGALAGALVPPMIVALMKLRTNAAILSLSMFVGAGTAIIWRLQGWNTVFNEAAPGIVAGLLLHVMLSWIILKEKSHTKMQD